MSSPPETFPEAPSGRDPGAPVRDGMLEIPGEVALHHGGRLEGLRLAWRLTGPAAAPVVVALGGISAHRRVFDAATPRLGWWSEVVGPGRALDTEGRRILSFDWLGGSAESSGPPALGAWPAISTYDQAELLLRLCNHLGIRVLQSIVGASYGGMVALAFGERYPERVEGLVVISAADRTHPMSTAWRTVQRRIVRLAAGSGRAAEGLALARALAMSTYRSPEEFAARFAGPPQRREEGFVFPVEDYLMARGADYASYYRPEAFCCLSESIDLHRVDATRVFVPTTAVAIREDQLVPLADMRALAARLPRVRLHELSSVYGHDAFLKEPDALQPIFAAALGESA